MKIYEVFKKFELVKDKKEFMELFYLRSIYINNEMLTDLSCLSENIKNIRVGYKEISI